MAAVSNIRDLEVTSSGPAQASAAPSLTELFLEQAPFLARSLRRLGVPQADLDDAIQEVFVVASRRMRTVPSGAERSFLYGTAMRIASNIRRVDKRARNRRADEPLESPSIDVDTGPSPEELVERREARATLDAVLETLSVEMRAVLTLFELEEMTTLEIANLLDLPPGTVSSRLHRAREQFDRRARELHAQLARQGRTP
jgi:RNA polymerase sigma-70 factor, ECF subfamily